MLNLHPLECAIKDYDHISDLLLTNYWVTTGCKYIVSKLRSAVFPKSLEKIGCEAFYHNEPMRRIEFNSMVSIDEAAFAGHSIFQSVKKPKELVISENVFEQNTSLDKFGFWD